jgi:hypothetical protein
MEVLLTAIAVGLLVGLVYCLVLGVGDVRGGNVKRVASAVGDGSICIACVHQVLHE